MARKFIEELRQRAKIENRSARFEELLKGCTDRACAEHLRGEHFHREVELDIANAMCKSDNTGALADANYLTVPWSE